MLCCACFKSGPVETDLNERQRDYRQASSAANPARLQPQHPRLHSKTEAGNRSWKCPLSWSRRGGSAVVLSVGTRAHKRRRGFSRHRSWLPSAVVGGRPPPAGSPINWSAIPMKFIVPGGARPELRWRLKYMPAQAPVGAGVAVSAHRQTSAEQQQRDLRGNATQADALTLLAAPAPPVHMQITRLNLMAAAVNLASRARQAAWPGLDLDLDVHDQSACARPLPANRWVCWQADLQPGVMSCSNVMVGALIAADLRRCFAFTVRSRAAAARRAVAWVHGDVEGRRHDVVADGLAHT